MTKSALLAACLLALLSAFVLAPSAQAAFAIDAFSLAATNQNSTPTTQAGAHPYQLHSEIDLHSAGGASDGDLRNLRLALPPGFLINPTAVAECSATAFHTPRKSPFEASASGESCPNSSQVGVIAVNVGGTTRHFGLFNLIAPFGAPAQLGASPFGHPLLLTSRLRESDYGLDLSLEDFDAGVDLQSIELRIWGTPWGEVHDSQRGNCLKAEDGGTWTPSAGEQAAAKCLVFDSASAPTELIKSFLTVPTTPCASPLTYNLTATSWQGAEAAASASTPALVKCNKSLATVKVQLMTDAAAARTGLAFNVAVNDGGGILNPGGIARPAIKQAISSLPEGLTVNPSLAAGLGTCTEAQFARESALSEPGAGCPNPSKIGTVTVEGTLGLAEPLKGSVYLATPFANPYQSMIALYLVARSARRGLIVKSFGQLAPDPRNGRLTATFDQLPRLLYTHFALTLREGQRSTLVSPPACGTYVANLALASYAEPSVFRNESSAFLINHAEGAGCPAGGVPPFHPGLLGGSLNPSPGVFTPLYLRMTRTDLEQEITSYSATLPQGLLGRIAAIPDCPESAIAAAASRSGAAEAAQPSCPAASLIGHTIAGYGVGGTLAYAPGNLYLAGPYHGAPLSILAVDSAVIGPFDLGVVLVRSAIRIDPTTAQVSIDSAASDPIPHILAGIPLHLRDIRVYVDRAAFTNTPTSCAPMSLTSTLSGAGADLFSGADETSATTSNRYQLLGCGPLGFRPKLRLSVSGATRHGANPALRAELRPRPGDANLGAVAVTLPRSLFVAQAHLRNVCTRVQFAADSCPADSVYGTARAFTPLLDAPLEGPVYLRSSSSGLPDIVFALGGRGGVRIEVVGRIDQKQNGVRATFTNLPDAPLTKFAMTLQGGRQSLFENEKDLCASSQFGHARLIGQSNLGEALRPRLGAKCHVSAKQKTRKRAD